MWCLDDTGRIAGIGLGHLFGTEHDSTPQSGVEAPRLLKQSLPRSDHCGCCFRVVWGRAETVGHAREYEKAPFKKKNTTLSIKCMAESRHAWRPG